MSSPTWHAVRAGLARGGIEFRAALTTPQDAMGYVIMAGMLLIPLFFLRNADVPGVDVPVATLAIPGVIGMVIVYGGVLSTATALATEREDGTLLRFKALPHGMEGYLAGTVVRLALEAVMMLTVLLIPAALVFDVTPAGASGWLTVLGLFALGLVAVIPLGLVVGSLAKSPRAVGGFGFLVIGGVVAISGIFYPITALAGWLQPIAQAFPVYWLGLGMRSAFLPDSAVAVEIGESWRTLEMLGVVGAWAVLALVVAPAVLRRMARRESGGAMEERRRAILQWRT
jgi:ABC-2 type transport system permease protein